MHAVVPPGYGVIMLPLPNDKTINVVRQCNYSYNQGWNRQACTSCGINVIALNSRTSVNDCCECLLAHQ